MANACITCCVCCLTKGGSRCCAIFSVVGTIFLASLGLLLQFQGEYIHIPIDYDDGDDFHHEVDTAKSNAYTGAATYAVVTLMCLISYNYHLTKEKRLGSSEEDFKAVLHPIPDLSFGRGISNGESKLAFS